MELCCLMKRQAGIYLHFSKLYLLLLSLEADLWISVDTATERPLMKLVRSKLGGKIVISIMYRLEAALDYDRILVLEGGKALYFDLPEMVVRKSHLFSTFRP